jgi:hypothetical protein
MGYLDNSTITVDAILTKRGRELLAQGRGATNGFNITQFALADDEIDYDLWNPAHPLGSDYYGVVIENMPITEAVPDETQSMKYKLVTLPRGVKAIPFVRASTTTLTVRPGDPQSFNIETFYYGGSNPGLDPILNSAAGYTVTLLDASYVTMFTTATTSDNNATPIQTNGTMTSRTATSESAIVIPGSGKGSKITITLETLPDVSRLEGTVTKTTKIIVTGNETGGRVVIPVTVRNADTTTV